MNNQDAKDMIRDLSEDQTAELIAAMTYASSDAERALLDYLAKVADPQEREQLADSKLWLLWQQASAIIEENRYYGVSRSEQYEATDSMYEMEEVLKEQPTSHDCRSEIADEVLKLLANDEEGTFEDDLINLTEALAVQEDEKRHIGTWLLENTEYWKDVAKKLLLEAGADDVFLDYQTSHLRYERDYLNLVEYYDNHGDHERAMAYAEEAIEQSKYGRKLFGYAFDAYRRSRDDDKLWSLYRRVMDESRDGLPPFWFSDHIEPMIKFCARKGDLAERDRLLVASLCDGSGKKELRKRYDRCASEMDPKRFRAEHDHLLEVIQKEDASVYLDILLDEGKTDEVLRRIIEPRRPYTTDPDEGWHYSDLLKDSYPREICEYWWDEAQACTNIHNRNSYERCTSLLNRIKALSEYLDREDEWRDRYTAFLKEHKGKRLLITVIDESGPARP